MRWSDTARSALASINARRLRSVLTMLGIMIGIAAVTLTVGLGEGAQQQVSSQINALGSNLLVVTPGSTTSTSGQRGGRGSATTLTVADATSLADPSVAPDIKAVAPSSSTQTELTTTSTNWTTSVVGTTPTWEQVRARTTSAGRFITTADVDSAAPVAVVGSTTAQNLWGPMSPVGQQVQINGSSFTVVGELASIGSTSTSDQDDQVIVPSSTYAARVATSGSPLAVSNIYIEATSATTLSAAYQEAQADLATRHGVTAANADFTISSQQSLLDTANSTNKTLTILLGGVAAISLIVGAIGVMNIMLVSVTERIREIGLRKSLGAAPRIIRRQFLVEAGTLALAGGALGIVLGVAGAALLPGAIGQPVSISIVAALGALLVSLVIGLLAGVYPASRAARLAPIDALRSE